MLCQLKTGPIASESMCCFCTSPTMFSASNVEEVIRWLVPAASINTHINEQPVLHMEHFHQHNFISRPMLPPAFSSLFTCMAPATDGVVAVSPGITLNLFNLNMWNKMAAPNRLKFMIMLNNIIFTCAGREDRNDKCVWTSRNFPSAPKQ